MKTPEEFGIENYTWNNGKLDVDGDVGINSRKLTELPFEFGAVRGNFYCYCNNLTSLRGAPERVGGNFDCTNNQLTSLQGAPKEVKRGFYCGSNRLTSLQGAPEKVGGSFHCRNNKLTSLQGAPEKVGGSFNCINNRLTSLWDAPKDVGGDFNCDSNELTSLRGAPERVGGTYYCDRNSLPVPQLLATLDDPLIAYSAMIKNKIKQSLIPKNIKDAWKKHLSGMDQLETIQEYAKYGLKIPKEYQGAKDTETSDDSELLNILEDLAK